MKKKWISRPICAASPEVVRTFGLHPIVAEMMAARGVTDLAAAERFLHATLDDRYDPFLMKGMTAAVERITQALAAEETIVVYGDYDVDGITSTSVLLRCLRALGARAEYYIPDRQAEGYGLHAGALEQLAADGARLVITVDCGISAADLVAAFADRLDFIITDHHNPGPVLPAAVAVLDHKQEGCRYPDKNLAGVGMAYTLCRALWRTLRGEDYTADVELVALGTVADVVALTDENRIYVREGLCRMADSQNAGLRALLEVCGVAPDAVTSERIGFSLAPRLNAAGRMAHARLGVELLLADNPETAKERAQQLFDLNSERQRQERELLVQAQERIAALGSAVHNALVVDGEGWHPGIIGIVASRLVEQYYRPTVMIAVDGDVGKGSCRSIPGFDIFQALTACKDLLIQFGGHNQAAGFSVRKENIPPLRERLAALAAETLTPEDKIPVLEVERELSLADIDTEFVRAMGTLEPFGEANPAPLFMTRGATLANVRRIGADRTHLKLEMRQEAASCEAVGWGYGDRASELFAGDRIGAVYALQNNEWQGRTTVQAVLRDIALEEEERVVLDRDMLAALYLKVKSLLTGRDYVPEQMERILAERHPSCSPRAIALAMRVFTELGIVARDRTDGDERYRWGDVRGKLDLAMSLTYLQYSKGGEGHAGDGSQSGI